MRLSFIAALAATTLFGIASQLTAAQSRTGLTVGFAAGPGHGFRGDYTERGGIAGTASLARSVWTTSRLALTVGLEASVATHVGSGQDNVGCQSPSCRPSFPAVSGIGAAVGWLAGRPDAGILFSGSLGVGRYAAGGATGLGLHLQAGVAVPFNSTWAVSVEGRATRTPRVLTEHLIAGALLFGLRWYQNSN